ncbi:uncharacterized protein [Typha latifolia]|uniref:uncharacterized protein n=1 Tax=Typha latifolia TaxID=4733 RepID=UPI003C2D37D0
MDPETQPQSDPPIDLGRAAGGTEYSWCRAVPGGTGTTVLSLLLSNPVPFPALQSALHNLHISHPILRSRLTLTPDSRFSFFIPASHDPPQILRSASSSDFHSLLELELNRNPWSDPLDSGPAEGVPVFFPTLYDLPEPGRSVLALRFHTAVCDRSSAVAILMELMGLMGEGGGGSDPEGDKEEPSVLLGIEDLIPKKDTWKPFWVRGKDLVGYSLNGFRTSTLRFEDTGSDRSTEMVRLEMTEEETKRLLDACTARGVKLCGAIAGAALVAARSSKQIEEDRYETYSVVTLIDCRKYLEPVLNEHDVGFYHSAITNTHSIHGGEGLWEVAERCHKAYSNAMSNKKHLTDIGDLNFLMCKAIENPMLTPSSSLRTAVISVFEEPVIYRTSELQQRLGVEDYVGCASVHGVGPSIGMFDTIRDGRLDCACVYPSPLHSRKQIEDLVEHMKRILIEGSHVDEGDSAE